MTPDPGWSRWFPLWVGVARSPARPPAGSAQPVRAVLGRTPCPHCTNLDTLTAHCRNDRCGWSRCTCGAVIYGGRRHRHPRHGSGADTCHDPVAAA